MSAKRRESADKARVSVMCSAQQRDLIQAAAAAAGTDMSTWLLAHGLRAVSASGTGVPVMLSGPVADRLRAAGERQGVSPERALEQLLIAGG